VATHLRDEGLQRLPNGEIFDKALRSSRFINAEQFQRFQMFQAF
jgi:hypothetical protein